VERVPVWMLEKSASDVPQRARHRRRAGSSAPQETTMLLGPARARLIMYGARMKREREAELLQAWHGWGLSGSPRETDTPGKDTDANDAISFSSTLR
jgi:hypothetical protein